MSNSGSAERNKKYSPSQRTSKTPPSARFTAAGRPIVSNYPELLKKILQPRLAQLQSTTDENKNIADVAWKYNEALDDTVPISPYIDPQYAPELFEARPSVESLRNPIKRPVSSPHSKSTVNISQQQNQANKPKTPPPLPTPLEKKKSKEEQQQKTSQSQSHVAKQDVKKSWSTSKAKRTSSTSSTRKSSRAASRTVLSNNPMVLLKLRLEDGEWILEKNLGQGLIIDSSAEVDSIYNEEFNVESVNLSRLPSEQPSASDLAVCKTPYRMYDEERLTRIRKYLARVNKMMDDLQRKPSATHHFVLETDSDFEWQQQQQRRDKASNKTVSYEEMSFIDKFFRMLSAFASTDANYTENSNDNDNAPVSTSSTSATAGNNNTKSTIPVVAVSEWFCTLFGELVTKFFNKDQKDNINSGAAAADESTSTQFDPPPPFQPKTKSMVEQEAQFEESLFNNQSIALLEEVQNHKEALLSQYHTLLEHVKSTTNLMDKVSNYTVLLSSRKSSAANLHNPEGEDELLIDDEEIKPAEVLLPLNIKMSDFNFNISDYD